MRKKIVIGSINLFQDIAKQLGIQNSTFRIMSESEKKILSKSAQSYLLELLYSKAIDSMTFETIMEVSNGFYKFSNEIIEMDGLKSIVDSVIFSPKEIESQANISMINKMKPDGELYN